MKFLVKGNGHRFTDKSSSFYRWNLANDRLPYNEGQYTNGPNYLNGNFYEEPKDDYDADFPNSLEIKNAIHLLNNVGADYLFQTILSKP